MTWSARLSWMAPQISRMAKPALDFSTTNWWATYLRLAGMTSFGMAMAIHFSRVRAGCIMVSCCLMFGASWATQCPSQVDRTVLPPVFTRGPGPDVAADVGRRRQDLHPPPWVRSVLAAVGQRASGWAPWQRQLVLADLSQAVESNLRPVSLGAVVLLCHSMLAAGPEVQAGLLECPYFSTGSRVVPVWLWQACIHGAAGPSG